MIYFTSKILSIRPKLYITHCTTTKGEFKMKNYKAILALFITVVLQQTTYAEPTQQGVTPHCQNSSTAKVSKDFVGYWKKMNPKKDEASGYLYIDRKGKVSIIYPLYSYYQSQWEMNLPTSLAFIKKEKNYYSATVSCEFKDYLKQQGQSNEEILKQLRDMQNTKITLENHKMVFLPANKQEKEIYEKADSAEVTLVLEKIIHNKNRINAIISSQLKPLVGKSFKLVSRVFQGYQNNGEPYTFNQPATQLEKEYVCNSSTGEKCSNPLLLFFKSTKKVLVNNETSAFISIFLKDSFPQFKNDIISLNVPIKSERSKYSSMSLVTGEFKLMPANELNNKKHKLQIISTWENDNHQSSTLIYNYEEL